MAELIVVVVYDKVTSRSRSFQQKALRQPILLCFAGLLVAPVIRPPAWPLPHTLCIRLSLTCSTNTAIVAYGLTPYIMRCLHGIASVYLLLYVTFSTTIYCNWPFFVFTHRRRNYRGRLSPVLHETWGAALRWFISRLVRLHCWCSGVHASQRPTRGRFDPFPELWGSCQFSPSAAPATDTAVLLRGRLFNNYALLFIW